MVDDDPGVREVAVSSLESFGYRLLAAENGLAALDVLKGTEGVDLRKVDMAMPGMNGVEVIRRARERQPGLRALLVSGYADIAAFLAGRGRPRSPEAVSFGTAGRQRRRGVATREVQTGIKRSENKAVAAEGIQSDAGSTLFRRRRAAPLEVQ